MSIKLSYINEDVDFRNKNIEIKVDDDVTISQLFGQFVDFTRMIGYQPKSWETLIDKLYGWCVLHVEASPDYDIYQWACDSEFLD